MEIGEQQQDQNKEEERVGDKSTTEQPTIAQSTATQTELVNVDANVNTDDTQKEKEAPVTELVNEEVKVQTIENPPPIKDSTDEDKTEENTEKEKIDKEEKKEEKKDTLSPDSKKKKISDDDDDDTVSIKGPIDMDNLSALELM
ncbi:nucleolar protein 58-like [Cryptomeria japonica]|uniref:nucleolar protein 58-like n=1 Tax=Cryptomeria japonica TaxID=3369 RepID=UPI0027DA6B04|nr:nucleolar protein 58-like [Cryptomeria japonica]